MVVCVISNETPEETITQMQYKRLYFLIQSKDVTLSICTEKQSLLSKFS